MKFNRGYFPIPTDSKLDQAILAILQGRAGRDQAIPRAHLLALVKTMKGCQKTSDRQLRAAINRLRKAGNLICSTGGDDGGYWIAANHAELKEFIDREFNTRISDLGETRAALVKSAKSQWGEGIQLGLL